MDKKNKTFLEGIIYGLIPHIGCIAFIIGSILGVTVLINLFRPLLLNKYFFYILFLVSISFATISALLYLRKNGILSMAGVKRKWKYLSTMYGSTIGVNLLLFFVLFPMLANVSVDSSPNLSSTGAIAFAENKSLEASLIKLKVDIPCSGHAALISSELKTLDGVSEVKFSSPNNFDVKCDLSKTSKEQILSLDVFKTYPATIIEEK
ncbi:MAG: hypothetical protein AB1467_03010 [Candidatus Diapherotrites archaeon]